MFLHVSVILFTGSSASEVGGGGGGFCLPKKGGSASGGGVFSYRGAWADPPPEPEKRAVHILLYFFLVSIKILQMDT